MQPTFNDDDSDSALGLVSLSHQVFVENKLPISEIQSIVESDNTSLSSSIARYRMENGRTYHAYKEGCELSNFFSTLGSVI